MSLSCLIALAMTSSTMLNRSGESGHLCCFSDFRGKTFDLSLLSVMWSVGLSHATFMMLWYVPYVSNLLRVFNHNRMLYFVKCILRMFWDAHFVFIFHSINVWVTFFCACSLIFIPWTDPTWSWCIIFSMCCWIKFDNILLRIIVSIVKYILWQNKKKLNIKFLCPLVSSLPSIVHWVSASCINQTSTSAEIPPQP